MIKIRTFGNLSRVDFFLNGGIAGGKRVTSANGRIFGLDGKTLIFTTPAGTVTFTNSYGKGHKPSDVISEIVAVVALSGLKPSFNDGFLNIIETTPTNGVVLAGTGTANSAFGFGNAVVAGTIYAPYDGTAPRLLEGPYTQAQTNSYYVVVEEA